MYKSMNKAEMAAKYLEVLNWYDPTGVWNCEADEDTALADITNYPVLVIEKLLNIIDDMKGELNHDK